jgi:putative membrane protein
MKFVRHATFTVIASALALGIVGCGGDQKSEPKSPETTGAATTAMASDMTPPAPTTPATPPADTAGTGSMGSTSGGGGMGSTTPAESPPTDENIAAIAGAANTSEIEQGKLASTKAKDPKVKKFGAMMVTDHGDVAKKHTELLKKTKMTPQDNSMSTMITSDSTKVIEQLKTATGAEFDKMYIDAQVKDHQMLLDALDQKLIPNAKNADLKAELTSIRPKVEAHLKQAQEIQKTLGTGTSTGTGMPKK